MTEGGSELPARLLGVVNLTRDSFSDGGRFLDPAAAIGHAERLLEAGADAIDLGAASSHPDAERVESCEEIRRLAPVVSELSGRGVPLSIDSFEPETQRWALEQGVAFLNDIRGFDFPALYPALAGSSARLIVMHAIQRGRAVRRATDAETVVSGVVRFLEGRVAELERAGVARERLLVDPGMGFFLGSAPEPSLAVLRALPEIRARLDLPVLVSVSRKSFLGALTSRPVAERGPATLAAELFAISQGASWIRTHDVAALRDALLVGRALSSAR